MSRRMRPLPTPHEQALEWLAGLSAGVAKGTVRQGQLDTSKRTVLRWGVDPLKVETTIANKKAPPRAGEI